MSKWKTKGTQDKSECQEESKESSAHKRRGQEPRFQIREETETGACPLDVAFGSLALASAAAAGWGLEGVGCLSKARLWMDQGLTGSNQGSEAWGRQGLQRHEKESLTQSWLLTCEQYITFYILKSSPADHRFIAAANCFFPSITEWPRNRTRSSKWPNLHFNGRWWLAQGAEVTRAERQKSEHKT